jgi:ketosteroid isomerase-like protein
MHSSVDDGADLWRRSLLALAALAPALAAGTTSVPAGTGKVPSDLAKAMKSYEQATFSNDIAALGELVSEDYLLVNSDTTLQDKQSYLADFKAPGFKLDPNPMQQAVLKVWGDTALAAGLLPLGWTQEGRHQSRLLRIAHVWAKHDGRWQLAYTQLTRVPQ